MCHNSRIRFASKVISPKNITMTTITNTAEVGKIRTLLIKLLLRGHFKLKKTLLFFLVISAFMINKKGKAQTLFIPTVVHILYNGPEQNMTDAEVISLIASINQGFAGASTNAFVSRLIFDTLWANTQVQFCLATKDPTNNPTTGIERTNISYNLMVGDFLQAKTEMPAWDVNQYFNIWISSQGAGSSAFGGLTSNALFSSGVWGVSVNKDAANFENVCIHECGHFVGLTHTFSDGIDDTPCETSLLAPIASCTASYTTLNTCSAEGTYWALSLTPDPPDMIENYMDYYLNCAKMFTKGQKASMRNYIITNYGGLLANQNASCAVVTGSVHTGFDLLVVEKPCITLSPNPAGRDLKISISGNLPVGEQLQIYNSIGDVLIEVEAERTMEVNISALVSGIYFIKLKNDTTQPKKLIKLE